MLLYTHNYQHCTVSVTVSAIVILQFSFSCQIFFSVFVQFSFSFYRFWRLFVKRFALCYRTIVCLSCLSVCDVGVLWSNGWMDYDATWYGGRPRSRPYCVRWGLSSPLKRGTPHFRPCSGQTVGWITMPLGTEVGYRPRSRRHCVRWEPSSPTKRDTASPPIFGPCLLWPNGRPSQLLLNSCIIWQHFLVLHSPNFWPMSAVTKRLDGQDATW